MRTSYVLGLSSIAAAFSLSCGCDEGTRSDHESTEELCYDGFDNDRNGLTDCEDDGCAHLFSCCVGSTQTNCCTPPATAVDLDLSTCANGDVANCRAGLTLFGSPAPRIEGGGFVPGGTTGDSGAWWPQPFDANTSILVLEFEAAARGGECTGSCLDAVGVGFVNTEPVPTTHSIRPMVSLILSASRGELSLIAANTLLMSWPVTGTMFHRWRLTLNPEGFVTVAEIDAAGEVIAELANDVSYPASDRTWLVFYGRSPDVDPAVAPSRVSHATVTRSFCDMPRATIPEADPILPAPSSSWGPAGATIPSAAIAWGSSAPTRLAFELNGAIHLASRIIAGSFEPTGAWPAPAFESPTFAPGGIGDPCLVADNEAQRWVLYFSARDSAGTSSVGQVLGGTAFAETFVSSTAHVVASGSGGLQSLDQPAVLGDIMVARATTSANITSLVVLRRADSADTFTFDADTPALAQIRLPNFETFAAFDHDEIGHPALVFTNEVYRLLFSGRRGTRWRLGLLVSDGGRYWRDPLQGEPLLELDEVGFDALGMTSPSALPSGGGSDVYYVGTDGARDKVGRLHSGGWSSWPLPPAP